MTVDLLATPRRATLPERLTIDVVCDEGEQLRELVATPTLLELDALSSAVDTAGLQWLSMLVTSRRRAKRATRIERASTTLCAACDRLGLRDVLGIDQAEIVDEASAEHDAARLSP